jgi:DNA polymerase-4
MGKELWQKVRKETGLPSSFGLSGNKTVSKIATDDVKPNSNKKVDRGTEKSYLAPMSVSKIPMVGEKPIKHATDGD